MSTSTLDWKAKLSEVLSITFYGQDFDDSIYELVNQCSDTEEDVNLLVEVIDHGIEAAKIGDEQLLEIVSHGNIYAPDLEAAQSFLQEVKEAYLNEYHSNDD
jgi:hypothetical protein